MSTFSSNYFNYSFTTFSLSLLNHTFDFTWIFKRLDLILFERLIRMENNTFGQNLRNLRTLKKISLHKLGAELDVTGSAISAWELGKKEPNFDMLKKIASYFMVSTDYLLNHQVLNNEEQKKAVVTQLADELYEKSQDIPVFKEELLSYIAYLDFKKKSEQTALENNENKDTNQNS